MLIPSRIIPQHCIQRHRKMVRNLAHQFFWNKFLWVGWFWKSNLSPTREMYNSQSYSHTSWYFSRQFKFQILHPSQDMYQMFPEVRFRKWANLMPLVKKEIGRYPVPQIWVPQSDNSDADLTGRYAENALWADHNTVYFYKDWCAKALMCSTGVPGWMVQSWENSLVLNLRTH